MLLILLFCFLLADTVKGYTTESGCLASWVDANKENLNKNAVTFKSYNTLIGGTLFFFDFETLESVKNSYTNEVLIAAVNCGCGASYKFGITSLSTSHYLKIFGMCDFPWN